MSAEVSKSDYEWTLMFFFAGDNALAPSMIPQVKAIKDAGFQEKTKVIVRFDPNEPGARTLLYDVNRRRRAEDGTFIGDGDNPYVRNMIEDVIGREELEAAAGDGAKVLARDVVKSDETGAPESLSAFLDYCLKNHPARHYILFLVGHGMVVGSDAFLPDDSPPTSISLEQLGEILGKFSGTAAKGEGALELLAMHSCSMSAVEVAYQLRGKARYMMASEGISFVGSLPYRKLIKKVLKQVHRSADNEVSERGLRSLMKSLFFLSLHNSTDFSLAGFSADLALCDLSDGRKFDGLTAALRGLTGELRGALKSTRGRDAILVAHWKAQSYWHESYTDLYDFCRCLEEGCGEEAELRNLKTACGNVIAELEIDRQNPFDRLVVFSEHIGPIYQYSHGLSVYFPWSEPIEDGPVNVMQNYEKYAFTQALKQGDNDDSWFSFLKDYFALTRREPRRGDKDLPGEGGGEAGLKGLPLVTADGLDAIAADTLAGGGGKPDPAMSRGKTSPADSGGVGCGCASVKNYPRDLSVSAGAREGFVPREKRQVSE